jgi:hypothetical protein
VERVNIVTDRDTGQPRGFAVCGNHGTACRSSGHFSIEWRRTPWARTKRKRSAAQAGFLALILLKEQTMPGRGPQTFKKRQKEQQRKERQQEKLARRLARKVEPLNTSSENQNLMEANA